MLCFKAQLQLNHADQSQVFFKVVHLMVSLGEVGLFLIIQPSKLKESHGYSISVLCYAGVAEFFGIPLVSKMCTVHLWEK